MKVYFKITTWECIEVPEDMEQKVLDGLENKTILTGNELCEHYGCQLVDDGMGEIKAYLDPNSGHITIEVFDGDDYLGNNVTGFVY
jgi:hypothetical protein